MLPCFGRERYRTLSHRWLPMEGGDGAILPPQTVDWWSILLTHENLTNGIRPVAP
jgi:hypothetical protein